jgi:hypothetical protein
MRFRQSVDDGKATGGSRRTDTSTPFRSTILAGGLKRLHPLSLRQLRGVTRS